MYININIIHCTQAWANDKLMKSIVKSFCLFLITLFSACKNIFKKMQPHEFFLTY